MSSDHDVVVTGIGATTPIGGTAPETWQAMLAGTVGVKPLTEPWAEKYDLPVRIYAPLVVEPGEVLSRVEARRLDRCQQVALVAAREAWADAGAPEMDLERLGVVVGTGIGGALTLLGQDDILEQDGVRKVAVLTVPMLMPNGPAAAVGLAIGAKGGVHAPVSACASGAEAVRWGLDLLRFDRADVVLVGGTEACIHPLPMAGFAAMRAMSTRNDEPQRASRPFDKARDGFVLGEGAGGLFLEDLELAKKRGAHIYAEVVGYGSAADGWDMIQPVEEGAGSARAMKMALERRGVPADEVDMINPHGTSTPVGDAREAEAVWAVFGDRSAGARRSLAISGTKSMTGHMMGAAGAFEAFASVMAIAEQTVPGTLNYRDPDPACDLWVVDETVRMPVRYALSNNIGLGGHNGAVIFKRYEGD
jgi:3-oxoacyl-[acyl-carrier-protein] synthase II